MTSNGGTLHGVIPPLNNHQQVVNGVTTSSTALSSSSTTSSSSSSSLTNEGNNRQYTCEPCGIFFESAASLEVHMNYHHENHLSRWGAPTSTSSATTTAIPGGGNTGIVSTAISSPSLSSSSSAVITSKSTSSIAGGRGSSNTSGNNSSQCSTGGGIINKSGSGNLSPTDSDNNNHSTSKQQINLQHHITASGKSDASPLHTANSTTNNNSTVSAAADSSDNQPPTPQPSLAGDPGTPQSYSGANSPYQSNPNSNNSIIAQQQPQEMHPFPSYMHGYDQYYHPPPNMDYGQIPPPLTPSQQAGASLYGINNSHPTTGAPHQEYKIVPSTRYHPYNSHHHHPHHHHQQQQQQQHHHHHQQQQQQQHHLHHMHQLTGASSNNTSGNTVPNSSLSPRVVSSSSPTQNAMIGQTPQESAQMQVSVPTQPTPSPSPKHCDKCGIVCETHAQLSEHYTTVHGHPASDSLNRSASSGGEDNDIQNQYSYQPYIKDEPASDILDLDSQKMVYPQHDQATNQDPLPSMHSMHSMQRPLMWGAPELHSGYMGHPHAQPDMKPSYYSTLKQSYPTIKQEYGGIKQEYASVPGYGNQIIKSEFNTHQQIVVGGSAQPTRPDIKPFVTELPTVGGNGGGGVNPSSSPSEFPTTTTPQENGPQFRGFEPPTSSLPSNTGSGKSTTWKSNEARRPKTYNCTACNKWFTSSGHLKRHYNTTLHKNAVKSSGQPDPATMPISAHHHPSRDPNSKHHRNNQSHQPPPAPPEPPRSPEYTPQYTPPPSGFSQPPQGFQQYSTSSMNTNSANGHPNGQAGPSVHASQPRGLLNYSTTATTTSNLEQEEQEQMLRLHQQEQIINLEHHHHQQHHLQYNHQMLDHHQSNQSSDNLQPEDQGIHILSMSDTTHRQSHHLQVVDSSGHTIPTMPTTTTTIINLMDPPHQQQVIYNPTGINTTSLIPSYHHTQLQEEHQQTYHTIIGNDSQITNNDTDNLIQFGTYNNSSIDHQHQPFEQQLELQQHQTATATNGQHHQDTIITTPLVPCFVEPRRLAGGVAQYQGDSVPPFSPDVPETYISNNNNSNSTTVTQTPSSMCIGGRTSSPQMPSTARLTPAPKNSSPTISSTEKYCSGNYELFIIKEETSFTEQPMVKLELVADDGDYEIVEEEERQLQLQQQQQQQEVRKPRKQRTSIKKGRKILQKLVTATILEENSYQDGVVGPSPLITADTTTRIIEKATSSSSSPPSQEKVRCEPCNKVFMRTCYLTQHNKTFHCGEKPVKCASCGKRFADKITADLHSAKHTGTKPFKCNECPKEFNHKTDLRRHNCIHTGTKPFKCPICFKEFIRKDHMVKHTETHKRKFKDLQRE